jgi:hypothetical protein
VRIEGFLRTPRGVLVLLAAALVFSAAVAAGLALHRDFFERHVRESYPAPSGLLAELGRSLDSPPGLRRLRGLNAAERRQLYTTWMQVGDSWPPAAPRAMMAADPPTFLDAAFQTLIAGSPEQRRRAVRFLALAGDPAGRELLEEALARARSRREFDLAAFICDAMTHLPERRER